MTCSKLAFLFFIFGIISVNIGWAQVTAQSVAVLQQEDKLPDDAQKITEERLTGTDHNKAASYYELLLQAKEEAARKGANALKILQRSNHSKGHSSDELQVAYYHLADANNAGTAIEWNAGRPLTWEDFRGTVRSGASPTAVAETSCGIAVETSISMPSDRAKIYVYNTFDRNESWVKPGKAHDEVLEHEQGHWNICALYTRRMQERFNRTLITGATLHQKVESIYDEVSREYQERQQQYEEETGHGTVVAAQHRWTKQIEAELSTGLTSRL